MGYGTERDLFIDRDGNSTVSMPMKVTNKAGQTDPGQKDAGNKLDLKKTVKKGWSK